MPPYGSDCLGANDSTHTVSERRNRKVGGERRACRVWFSAIVKVQVLRCRNEDTHEALLTWFSKSELESIRNDCKRIVKNGDEKDHCLRGLESMTKQGYGQSKSRRNYASSVLMEEQQGQRRYSMSDPKELARVYRYATLRSVDDAIARAAKDALDARLL